MPAEPRWEEPRWEEPRWEEPRSWEEPRWEDEALAGDIVVDVKPTSSSMSRLLLRPGYGVLGIILGIRRACNIDIRWRCTRRAVGRLGRLCANVRSARLKTVVFTEY